VPGRVLSALGGGPSWHGGFLTIDADSGDDTLVGSQAAVRSPATFASAVALDGTRVFVGSSAGTLEAFAAAGCGEAPTCAPVWQGTTGGAVTAPAVANEVVYVGSADGFVHAFAAAGCGQPACAPLWSAATPGEPTQVVVADGRVHVLTSAGDLAAIGLP
jgi:outer membrane protein assembly factor BamB